MKRVEWTFTLIKYCNYIQICITKPKFQFNQLVMYNYFSHATASDMSVLTPITCKKET